jgi:hypothetical protein
VDEFHSSSENVSKSYCNRRVRIPTSTLGDEVWSSYVHRSVHVHFQNDPADTAQTYHFPTASTSISTKLLQMQFRSYWRPSKAPPTMVKGLTGTTAKLRTLRDFFKHTYFHYPNHWYQKSSAKHCRNSRSAMAGYSSLHIVPNYRSIHNVCESSKTYSTRGIACYCAS